MLPGITQQFRTAWTTSGCCLSIEIEKSISTCCVLAGTCSRIGTRGQVAAGLSESATGRICTSPSSPAIDVGGHCGCCLELGGGGQLRGILIGTGGLGAMGLVKNAPQAAIAIVSSECATGRIGGSPAVDSLTSQSLTCKATRGRWKHPPPSHTQTVEAPTRTASAQLSSSEVF